MNKLPQSDDTLLVRTDFSDEAAWHTLRVAVTTPAEGEEGYQARLHIVDDPSYGGLTTEQVVALAPTEDDLLIMADKRAMNEAGMPLLAVHVREEDDEDEDDDARPERIEELRVIARDLWAVEANIAMANMDWEEFVEAADEDGVFRGF
ncbi:hypothetical protein [Streptomyces sp. E5N91]|uniref:DUF6924 domain-containing protein n=1 Tax=Streptomyces sp. E5N91 TaxID=1851996 RepID=UPI000EF5799A|nr:hypothetical protein [Streptomyces sp. E5N91]